MSGSIAPQFFILALEVGEWSVSRSCHFNQSDTVPGTYWIRSCVGYRTELDAIDRTPVTQLVDYSLHRGQLMVLKSNVHKY
jgi:hypothetical protein